MEREPYVKPQLRPLTNEQGNAAITAADLRAAREATEAQRSLELALLAAEARLALEAVSPLVALLPEPARTVVGVLARIVERVTP